MKRILNFIRHPLFTGSAVMIIGSNFSNFLAFIYHLIIGRLLGPSSYGDLASVISLSAMFSAAFTFIGTVIIKFVSSAESKSKLTAIFSWFTKKTLLLCVVFFALIILLSPVFSNFLHVENKIILLLPLFISFSVMSLVLRSYLQGLLKFIETTISLNIEFLLRLVFGVLFVYLGWSVFGAVLGIALSGIIGFFVTLFFLKDFKIFSDKKESGLGAKIFAYSLPVFLFSLASTSFLTTDTILAKHFLSSHDAGIYASLSTLGKIILYASGPVGLVMFPMVSKRFSKGEKYIKIFLLSLFLTVGISLGVLFVYQLFPALAIKVLYGEGFIEGKKYLIWFGLFATAFTLSSLISSFYLSIGKTKVVVLPIFFAVLQIIGIVLFHDSILTIISVSFASSVILFLCLLIYFGYEAHFGSNSRLQGREVHN
ncbi:MAG: Capsular polysaccharide biosynthesis protein [Candidatus Woesebacteria bacterium GW2011_GWB1_40_101]|uniref:Capsular polysaccharide biosynthesis protein n=1 Tax=Candidatus Woesebacteria bacterium GW2011_GWB1_40_101 TaxID=1618575 RepID=A0A0G0SWQ5_9BACT|nr:MAG: Capsular polysaccharide biosynthesis protein [Candidatus Woesebacteria bacterium GW2011_GWB1_40_101]